MTSSNYIFGNYGEQLNGKCEYLTLAFSPLSAPLRTRWRNNGLSADFLGDYVMTFLPKEGGCSVEAARQHELRHTITYIANELLENSMKFHIQGRDIPISIHLELSDSNISVTASNGVDGDQADRYITFVRQLLASDPNELLIERLESGASEGNGNVSGLGLVTMITDYGAQLGWNFECADSSTGIGLVTTRAVLALRQ
jgi:hypothetical protein